MRGLAEWLGLRAPKELDLARAKRTQERALRAQGFSRTQARRAVAEASGANKDKHGK